MKLMLSAHKHLAEAALERLAALRARASRANEPLVPEVLEELGVALHELQATTDELQDQNELLLGAETEIVRERERYRRLFDFGPDGYIVTDLNGVILEANRTAGVLLARDPALLAGKPLAVFIPIRERARFRSLIARLGKTNTVQSFATQLNAAQVAFPVSIRVLPMRDGEGAKPAEVWWTIRDLSPQKTAEAALIAEASERRRAETALQRSEHRYRHLLEYAQELVYEIDAEGRFTFCNDAAAQRLLGYTRAELLGRPFTDLVPRNHRRAMREFVRRLKAHADAANHLEIPLCAKDGRQIWIEQRAAVVEGADGAPRLQGVCRNISDQRERIRQLEVLSAQSRDMAAYLRQQIEAERSRIAHDIHDELGAVLTGIRMELALQRSQDSGSSGGTSAALVARVDDAIALVRRICSDLRPSLLDNMGLGAAIEWLAQDAATRFGIHCEVALQGVPDDLDRERATALFRIVQEAVTNTLRHAKATTLSITQRRTAAEIIVDVVDDGRGIRAAEREGRKSFGIVGMHERAIALGGRVRVTGGRQGTRVTIRAPLRAEVAHARAAG